MKSGREIPDKYNLESLRLLGTVGEPINPEAWIWYKDCLLYTSDAADED